MMKRSSIYTVLWASIIALALSSCSTTRRLAADETLYTGVKKVNIVTPEGDRIAPGVADDIKSAVNVKPNNCLISPSIRYPFPLGLWVYNNWSNPPKGFKHWIYEKLVEQPVLISDVRPEIRTKMIDEILDNNGYFMGSASYTLNHAKNPKKASITYNITTGPAYTIDSLRLLPDSLPLYHLIDSVVAADSYLRVGARYCTDSLAMVRNRIANAVRNRGYYFFRPDFIEYLADSLISRRHIVLQLTVASNIPQVALSRYVTGNVTMRLNRNNGGGRPDTIQMERGTLIQYLPSRFRHKLMDEWVTFRKGRVFSVRNMDRTQNFLSRLGIFNDINISVSPDTTAATLASDNPRRLDVLIDCTFDMPLEASVEVNASSKSNSYIGPGITIGLTNRNIFGGGEQLSAHLTGSYEWQTGHNRSSVFNSYEVGLQASLAIPRLLAPRFIPRRRYQLNWTRASIGADLLNRPHYFKMAQFNTSWAYDWRVSRHVNNSLTLFKLTYTKLLKTTAPFDSITAANPAIALSFRNQFIPQMSYTYTYDRAFDSYNALNFTFTATEAGNIFSGIWSLAGSHGEKRLFGTPFSQFVKGTTQLVYNRRITGDNHIVTRLALGAAHAYGNSSQVPYAEQFYVGGANSIRAFTVRSIGPGSYRAPRDQINGYFDQTGTFKMEFNVEYRFPIISVLHGAVFLDTGNVWLLKNDPNRPGGQLKASTFLKDIAVGTGVGLRIDISMIVIRGDLGIGIHAPYNTGRHGYYNMTSFGNSLAFHLAIGYPF